MAISQEQQQRGLEHLKQIRRKYFSESSEAAEWWDNLTPEWRGVVLHAAAVTSGGRAFKAHLSKCCWRELYERLGYSRRSSAWHNPLRRWPSKKCRSPLKPGRGCR